MILPDVNVLIYAFRPESEFHEASHRWLINVIDARSTFAVSPVTLSAVVRVTTQRKFYNAPSSLQEAFDFCDDLVSNPNCRIIAPGPRHWDIFKQLCAETNTTGPRVTDAWFAALAIEWGCEWITFDRDFGRFPGLKWNLPQA